MMWAELLDCGCCAVLYALVPMADGTVALVSVLVPLDDPELVLALDEAEAAIGGAGTRIAALADATDDDRRQLAAFAADDAVLRDRAVAAWYGAPGDAA